MEKLSGADRSVASIMSIPDHNYTPKEVDQTGLFSNSSSNRRDASNDQVDMYRLGKKQELKRRFNFFSIASFIITLGLCWEFSFVTAVFGLANGGTAGVIWLTLAVCGGMFFTMMSMAECASMAPTSGGQYHWVSEFAPRRYQKFISYCVGWLCSIGWQAGLPSTAYIGASQIVALITVCDPSYQPQRWHSALLTMAFAICGIIFNILAINWLPLLEIIAAVIHTIGFFAFVILLWVTGPKDNPREVWFQFEDQNNWGSIGLAVLVSMIGPATTYVGGDSAVHLAEEMQNASYSLPRAMIAAAIINYVTGFIATVTLVSNLGDLDAVLSTATGQPWVAVMYNATGSKTATIVLVSIMIFLFFFTVVGSVTASSRQIFAFSRDKGLPFHKFISRVGRDMVPINSVYVTLVFTCLMSLIIFGSTVAFNIILSVSGVGLFISYTLVISCVVVRRFSSEPFPPSKFSLGKFGLPINIIAIMFLSVVVTFIFFPATPNPTAESMNWVCLIFGGLVMIAALWYVFRAHHEYHGPVTMVRKEALQTENEAYQLKHGVR